MYKIREKLDFEEIRKNLRSQIAKREAERCLYCYDAPCIKGCPAEVNIPEFIQSIRSNNLNRAARLINQANPFGAVCGRVCPTDKLCEKECTARKLFGRSIAIGMLQRFAMDYGKVEVKPVEKDKGQKVAVIGSGPAGLSCARELARNGYEVTVFESKEKAGGMISYGVPEYRCPHSITQREVELIEKEGVEIRTSTPVNKDVTTLFEVGYDAVFVAIGLTKTSRPKISGMHLKGVYMGLDFLSRVSSGDTPEVGKKVVVVGGGDTAMDCARVALRIGAEEVTLVYRRSFTELPADKFEIEEALEEGIIFRTLAQPVALHGDNEGILRAVELVNMKLGHPDASGRRKPVEIKGSNHRIPCNTFIFATGTEPSGLLGRLLTGAEFISGRYPKVDPKTYATSIPGVFAGGDVVSGGATVVQAVADGKAAARGIMAYLEEKKKVKKPEETIKEADEALKEADKTLQEVGEDVIDPEIEKKREELKKKWKEKLKTAKGNESSENSKEPKEDPEEEKTSEPKDE